MGTNVPGEDKDPFGTLAKGRALEHDDASAFAEGGYVNAVHAAAQTAAKVDKPE